jgi:hypothetical protein
VLLSRYSLPKPTRSGLTLAGQRCRGIRIATLLLLLLALSAATPLVLPATPTSRPAGRSSLRVARYLTTACR